MGIYADNSILVLNNHKVAVSALLVIAVDDRACGHSMNRCARLDCNVDSLVDPTASRSKPAGQNTAFQRPNQRRNPLLPILFPVCTCSLGIKSFDQLGDAVKKQGLANCQVVSLMSPFNSTMSARTTRCRVAIDSRVSPASTVYQTPTNSLAEDIVATVRSLSEATTPSSPRR